MVLGGHRGLGGSCSSLSVGPSSLCIPSGHQSRGKEGTAVPREGFAGGWDTLAQVPGQLWSRSLLFWHLFGKQWWEGRGEQDVEGQSPTLGPALLCLIAGAWQRVRVGGGCRFWGKKGLFHPKSVCTRCCQGCAGGRGRETPGCQG